MRKLWIIPAPEYRSWTSREERRLERPFWRAVCPTCNGSGGWIEYIGLDYGNPWQDCYHCHATGHIPIKERIVIALWNALPLSLQEKYFEYQHRCWCRAHPND